MIDDLPGTAAVDMVVVDVDPAGASIAYHLASLSIDVLVLEKAQFPRDKICGSGLTPTVVHEFVLMRMDTSEWTRNRGLTVIGGGHTMTLGWPNQRSPPGYGITRARIRPNHELITRTCQAGARLIEGATVTGVIQDATGRVLDVNARVDRDDKMREFSIHIKFIADCGGAAARLATLLGLERKHNRLMGVAVRTYFHNPHGGEEFIEAHLGLWNDELGRSKLPPGYGWIFPMDTGVVSVDLGSVSSAANAIQLPYKKIFEQQTANLPEHWGFTAENQIGPLCSVALPMSSNRSSHYISGLVLVDDVGGMVLSFNGGGIASALEADRFAARYAVQVLLCHSQAGSDQAMNEYPELLRKEYGDYYQLGRIFVALIEEPQIMQPCTDKSLPILRLMTFVNKFLFDDCECKDGGPDDRLIAILTRLASSL